MNDTPTADDIRELIASELGQPVSECGDDRELGTIADSLDRVEIAMVLERDYDLDVHDDAVDAWRTVGDVIATVQQLLREKEAAAQKPPTR